MKSSSTRLHLAETSAPALNRGLALLAVLAEHGPSSLEQLAGALDLPKASAFRLLDTLRQVGMIRKGPDKRYECLWRLQPLADHRARFRDTVIARMEALCSVTDCTVEWYEPTAEGMRLIHQVNPDTELRVQAQPGFLRRWGIEFEAVARLGHAFADSAPEVGTTSMFVSHGVLQPLTAARVRSLLGDARLRGSTHDAAYNTNGVRRYAAAATGPDGLMGVLALAECHRFGPHRRPAQLAKALVQSLP